MNVNGVIKILFPNINNVLVHARCILKCYRYTISTMKYLLQHKIGLIILISIFFAHVSYINNGFTWLDHGDIEGKRAVVPLTQIPRAFTLRYGETGYYRPLVTIVHSLNYALYHSWTPGYHLTNILLHLAVSITSAVFLTKFFELKKTENFVVMLVVGLAPISWFTVGTISNLQELLAVLFTLTSVYLHSLARTHRKPGYAIATLVSFSLALLSKETTLFWIPALIILWEVSQNYTWQWIRAKLLFSEGILALFYLVLHIIVVPEIWKTESVHLDFSQALGTRLGALGSLLVKLINPLRPSVSDATRIVDLTNPVVLTLLAVLALSLFMIVKSGIRSNWAKALMLFFIFIFPAANIVPLPRFSSTHYGYILTVALAAGTVLLLRTFAKHSEGTYKIAWVGLSLWLITAGYSTFVSGFAHQDDLTLFGPEVVKDPLYKEGHFYLGNYYFARGQIVQAENLYTAALTQTPGVLAYVDTTAAMINLSGVLIAQNQLDKAENLLKEAQKLQMSSATRQSAIYTLALMYLSKEDHAMVVTTLRTSDYQFSNPNAYFVLAQALYKSGRKDEAIAVLQKLEPLLNLDQKQKLQEFMKHLESEKL